MKETLKDKKTYILAAFLFLIAIIIPLTIFFISLLSDNFNFNFDECLKIVWAFFFLYLLIGFVTLDLTRVKWRRQNQAYDDPFPYEIKVLSWKKSGYFLLAGFVLLFVLLIFEIIYFSTGSYPFM